MSLFKTIKSFIKQDDKTQTQSIVSVPTRPNSEVRVADYSLPYGFSAVVDPSFNDPYTQVNQINDLIQLYRKISNDYDMDYAINQIVDEAIVDDGVNKIVALNLDSTSLSDPIKRKIVEQFDVVLRLLKFKNKAKEYFRQWYIDGRFYVQHVVDTSNLKRGIISIVPVDPLNIRLVKDKDGSQLYFYKDTRVELRLPLESVTFVPSGLIDYEKNFYISYVHRAIKPLNNLRTLENSAVIYRFTRAPERRVFYIGTGNMPKNKAEQFIQNMMNKFKNRLTYDSTTGAIAQQKSVHTMIEDYWIPRGSEDGRNTEITTLPGGQNLDQIDDIQYFRRELYKSLLLPPSRLNSEQSSMVSFGRMGEITRDELIFYKFIQKLQNNFASLLLDVLSIQLDLKGIIKKAEFDDIRPDISIRWTVDNYFEELKRADIDQRRIEQIQAIEPYIGKYFSHEYVNKNILCRTEDQVEDMMAKMDEESDIYPVSHEGLESEDTAQPQQQVSQNPVMTSRETEILGLLKRNKGMADIAKELGISKSTVFAHKLRLSKKYGIKFNTK